MLVENAASVCFGHSSAVVSKIDGNGARKYASPEEFLRFFSLRCGVGAKVFVSFWLQWYFAQAALNCKQYCIFPLFCSFIMAQYDSFDADDLEIEEDTQKDRYLTFRIAAEEYGVEIRHITEIIGVQKITEVPDTDSYLKGVINLRGKIIPVMDVRLRFGMQETTHNDRTCIVVVDVSGTAIGLIVDEVLEVVNIPEENVSEPPRTTRGSGGRYIQGMGKIGENVKILLNIERLLSEDELVAMQNLA